VKFNPKQKENYSSLQERNKIFQSFPNLSVKNRKNLPEKKKEKRNTTENN
jgi:hypothetical protein